MEKLESQLNRTVNKLVYFSFICSGLLVTLGAFVFGTSKDYKQGISVSNVTWALNTVYQPSTSRDAHVLCGGALTANLTITAGQTETIAIQTSPDNVTYTTVGTMSCGNTGTLVIGVATSSTQSSGVTFTVPRGYYFKLVSSGTGTAGSLPGQQELFN